MQLDVRVRLRAGLGPHILQEATQVVGYVRPQLDRVDVAGAQDPACVGILDEREQQMLEKHGAMRLSPREPAGPLEALGEVRRHRNRFVTVPQRFAAFTTPSPRT